MKKLIIKSVLTTAVFLLVILVFVYNLIFNPLYQTLEETLLENFVNITETSKVSFKYIIERGIENSKSISSRTMIKSKIIDYKNGLINLQELRDYTQAKFLEGIEALENVAYSCRVVDNTIIASSGEKIGNIETDKYTEDISYEIFEEDNATYLLVYSPIKSTDIIGMDIIVFDLSDYLPEIELRDMSIDMIKKSEIEKYQDKETRNPLVSEYKDLNEISYISVFYKINNNCLRISVPKDSYYDKFNATTKKSAVNLIIVFIFSFFCINIIIAAFANKKLISLDRSYRKHRRNSYYDTLTGAYSRTYLEKWLKDNSNKLLNHSVIFTDMNNFKEINDKYGHKKGDEVLKSVILTIENEIRDEDFIVRFGGDEFIIILNNISEECAVEVIKRINKNLDKLTLVDLKISLAYGVGELQNTNEFYDLLDKLDREMYEMKKHIKI